MALSLARGGKALNKGDLAAAVADQTGLSKAAATQVVEATFRTIAEAMRRGEEVRVLGFGSFLVTDRGASTGRHPQTGEAIDIGPSRQPKFKPGQGLKDAINN